MHELLVQLQLELPASGFTFEVGDPCPRPCEAKRYDKVPRTVVATTFAIMWECSGPNQPIEGKGVYLIFVICLVGRSVGQINR
jgi:hypothetical protein